MPKILLNPKASGETTPVVFDFSSYMTSTDTISSASCTCTVYSGTDGSPSSVISGSASISGNQVTQTITGGINGVTYNLSCTATYASGQICILTGYLAVLQTTL